MMQCRVKDVSVKATVAGLAAQIPGGTEIKICQSSRQFYTVLSCIKCSETDAEVKNEWRYTSSPPYFSTAW
jgi:hypothetical protein